MDKVSLLAGGWNAGDYFWSAELGWFIDLADRLSLMFRVFWEIGSIGIKEAYSYYSDKIIDETKIIFRFFRLDCFNFFLFFFTQQITLIFSNLILGWIFFLFK